MLDKSLTTRVDGLVYDLEDSVSPEQKELARQQVARHLRDHVKGSQERIVRINSRNSGLARNDIIAVKDLTIDAVMLPKTETADDIRWLAGKLPDSVKIIALIESAKAVMNIQKIAKAHKSLSGLVFAAEDYAASMSITRSPELTEMLFARQSVVTAAKAHGLDAIDLVCTSYKDLTKLEAECASGAAFGYSGKQAIHPSQISTIQAAFSPSQDQVAWAKALLSHAKSIDRGAFEFQGQMIDAPVLLKARDIIARHLAGSQPLRGLLLGAPGAGKGTQSKRITETFPEITILSSGDLLRDHMHRGTEIGLRARDIIARGELVDDATMCALVISTLQNRGILDRSFFLDGFPRTLDQAKALDKYLMDLDVPLTFIIDLDVPYRVIIDRIINRWIHAPSGRTYNLTYNPPKSPGIDDITGEALTKRVDDDVETFQARLETYDTCTVPLREYYRSSGILRTFSGETSDAIWPQIKEGLEKVLR